MVLDAEYNQDHGYQVRTEFILQVAQRIEHRSSKPTIGVQFPSCGPELEVQFKGATHGLYLQCDGEIHREV